MMLSQLLTVFGAGVLSSLTPCVYPMIPITLGYLGIQDTDRHFKLKLILFFSGQIIALTTIGLLAVRLGEVFGFTSQNSTTQIVIGFTLVIFGVLSFLNYLPNFVHKVNKNTKFNFVEKDHFFFPVIVGISSALVASPCTSPILGSVLTTLSTTQNYAQGAIFMLFYALGASLIFLVLGLGLLKLQKIPRAGKWMNRFHSISSLLILGAGFYYLYLGFFEI